MVLPPTSVGIINVISAAHVNTVGYGRVQITSQSLFVAEGHQGQHAEGGNLGTEMMDIL